MKVAILAGGMGTRLAEETDQRPKPMVEIGGKPILWHVMKYYSSFRDERVHHRHLVTKKRRLYDISWIYIITTRI